VVIGDDVAKNAVEKLAGRPNPNLATQNTKQQGGRQKAKRSLSQVKMPSIASKSAPCR